MAKRMAMESKLSELLMQLGTVNYTFASMKEIIDVEAKEKYAELLEEGMTPEFVMSIV